MVALCALCKGKKPKRTHMFPQNSRAEVQTKWVEALQLPEKKTQAILAEMRQIEEAGRRPRWCSFHFGYDDAGVHFPKFFDPDEGRAEQGVDAEEEEDDDEHHSPQQRVAPSSELRRRSSGRKRSAPTDSPSTSKGVSVVATPADGLDISLKSLLAGVGINLPGNELPPPPTPLRQKLASPPASTTSSSSSAAAAGSGAAVGAAGAAAKTTEPATSMEQTLHSILMGAGLPVPETLRAKTGLAADAEGADDDEGDVDVLSSTSSSTTATTRFTRQSKPMLAMRNSAAEKFLAQSVRRVGTFRGGCTLESAVSIVNPIATKMAANSVPSVFVPKNMRATAAAKMPMSFFNHNTMEKYDDNDSLRHFRMPCHADDCRSELTVIMARALALEKQFDELTNCVLNLTQVYKTKPPGAGYRPPQSLATVAGRAANVSGPVYCQPLQQKPRPAIFGKPQFPANSLASQERKLRKTPKQPVSLLTVDDLAGAVRRRRSAAAAEKVEVAEEETEEEEEDEDDEDAPDLAGESDGEWRPHTKRVPSSSSTRRSSERRSAAKRKRRQQTSSEEEEEEEDAASAASPATSPPPQLEMA